MLTFKLKWACSLQVQRGVHPRPPARTIRTRAQLVGKRAIGVVEVINGADEGQGRVQVQTQGGTLRVPAGMLAVVVAVEAEVGVGVVVHGVAHRVGIFDSVTSWIGNNN